MYWNIRRHSLMVERSHGKAEIRVRFSLSALLNQLIDELAFFMVSICNNIMNSLL